MRIALIGCGKSKRPTPAVACELYTGTLFRYAWRFAIATCDRQYILSAKHGLLAPTRVVAPYDLSLGDMRAREREKWAERVREEIQKATAPQDVLVLLAGSEYARCVAGLPNQIENPLLGLSLGLRAAWLKARVTGQRTA